MPVARLWLRCPASGIPFAAVAPWFPLGVGMSGWWGGKKVPYAIRRADNRPAVLAGIWREDQFTILTCEPSPELTHLHNRMPVVIAEADWKAWLEPTTSQ